MTIQNIFKGLGIALVTPFKTDGSIDFEALERLVEYQLDNGADFLCILATTGETPCLTAEEKSTIKQRIVAQVRGRVPILMGCGGNNTAAVVEELRHGDFQGIDGILSVCPYYNKPSQEGLYQHFKAIASATSLPVVLYNVPSRTGILMKALADWHATALISLLSRRPAEALNSSTKSSKTNRIILISSAETILLPIPWWHAVRWGLFPLLAMLCLRSSRE